MEKPSPPLIPVRSWFLNPSSIADSLSPLADSLKGWHYRWFYVSNPNPALPAYIGRPPMLEVSWNSFPCEAEMKDVRLLIARLEAIKIVDQLSGVVVVRYFIERRIQPIKERHHPAYEYSGQDDPTRESSSLWVPRALVARTSSLFQTDVAVRDIPLSKGYTLDHPPPQPGKCLCRDLPFVAFQPSLS